MRPQFDIKTLTVMLRRCLHGPQMLAFLPALCLCAYWAGGEVLLVLCALATPLIYALTGGFGQLAAIREFDPRPRPSLDIIAQQFLEVAQHNGQTTACFQIEIGGLDDILRTLGRSAADEARHVLEARMVSTLREADHVSQTGDTRFTVLIAPGFRLKLDNLLDLGKRLRHAAEEPLSVSGTTQYVSLCIGIASSLNFGRNVTARTWLVSATQALDDAIDTGVSATRVWSDKLSRKHQIRRDLQNDVVSALDAGHVQAFFQPQVNVRTGDITGMEALARWDHPTRGMIPASGFLKAIEDSGQMQRLGKTILSQALVALQAWDAAGFDIPTVSVNFSDGELRNPDVPDHIKSELDRLGILAHRLVIEVRESVVANGTDDIARRTLVSLAETGCRIDLDNFGQGSLPLAQLQQFPIQRVKIDKSMVRGADISEAKRRMLGAILGVTERLDLQALGEGVETVGEHGVLRELGCAFAQGFLFKEPASASDIAQWLAKEQARDDPTHAAHLRRVK